MSWKSLQALGHHHQRPLGELGEELHHVAPRRGDLAVREVTADGDHRDRLLGLLHVRHERSGDAVRPRRHRTTP